MVELSPLNYKAKHCLLYLPKKSFVKGSNPTYQVELKYRSDLEKAFVVLVNFIFVSSEKEPRSTLFHGSGFAQNRFVQ